MTGTWTPPNRERRLRAYIRALARRESVTKLRFMPKNTRRYLGRCTFVEKPDRSGYVLKNIRFSPHLLAQHPWWKARMTFYHELAHARDPHLFAPHEIREATAGIASVLAMKTPALKRKALEYHKTWRRIRGYAGAARRVLAWGELYLQERNGA